MTTFVRLGDCAGCDYLHDQATAAACEEALHLQREVAKVVAESECRSARHGRALPSGFSVTIECRSFWQRGRKRA